MSSTANKGNPKSKPANQRTTAGSKPNSGQRNQTNSKTGTSSGGKQNQKLPSSGKSAQALPGKQAKATKPPDKDNKTVDPTKTFVNDMLEDQNRQLLKKVGELEDEIAELKKGKKGEKEPGSEKAENQKLPKDVSSESTTNGQELKNLRNKSSEQEEIDRLEEKTKKQNEEIQKYSDDLEKCKKDLESTKTENSKLQENLKQKTSENSSIIQENDELKKRLEKNNKDTKGEDKDKSKLKEERESKEKVENKMKELQKSKVKVENEMKELQTRCDLMENEYNELKKSNSTTKEQNDQSKADALKKIASLEEENARIRSELEKTKEESNSKTKGNNNQSKTLTEATQKISNLEKENAGIRSELEKIKKERSEEKNASDEGINKLTVDLSIKEEDIRQLKEEVSKLKQEAKKDSRQPGGNEQKLKEEIETLRNRLSQMAGAKLTDNNPAIADLSDSNRPMKLGENFSELYDNEWTDALEEMMDELKITEEKSIDKLLNIVQDAYAFCVKKAKKFTEDLKSSLKPFISDKDIESLPAEMSKLINDHRKAMAVFLVDNIQKEFLKSEKSGQKTEKYKQKCVALCWFMTVQSPAVYFSADVPKGKFDTDKYKAYTKAGKSYNFLVWPALYLHKNGPLLGKGVAQGK